MDYTPNPITFGQTPPGGVTLSIAAGDGSYDGWVLLSVSGTAADLTMNGQPLALPYTLKPGDVLRLTRGAGDELTVLHALAPVTSGYTPPADNPGTPFSATTDADGYETIGNAEATTDADGYQTIEDAMATTDADGYESVERSD